MGEVFAGRYELIDPIASGGMGTVWLIHDREDDQVKAAKILRQSDASSLLRFVREQSMRIDHAHVVTPQSWAGMDERVLFTMPVVRGGSVAGLIKRHGSLPARWSALLLDQTLQALEAVHGAGIVHRDVKPANLLLEPTGRGRPHLRLTDFGIAAPLDEPRMTRASMAIGSPGYMAPEQWHGADPDPRADLYSVARVGTEMLTGERPPAEPTTTEEPVRTGDPHRDALLEVLEPALAQSPDERPESATAMRAALAALELENLPPEPDEDIVIGDEFSASPAQTTAFPATATVAGDATLAPTRRPGTAVLAQDGQAGGQPAAHPGPARGSAVPGLVLIGVGLIALVAAVGLLVA